MNGEITGDRTVADVMVPLRDGCVPMNRADDVLEMLDAIAVAGMPVARSFGADEMLGVVMREDLASAVASAEATRIVDLPWQPVVTVRPDQLLASIDGEGGRMRVVLNDAGTLVGVLDAAG